MITLYNVMDTRTGNVYSVAKVKAGKGKCTSVAHRRICQSARMVADKPNIYLTLGGDLPFA